MIDKGNSVDIFARFKPNQKSTHAIIDEYYLQDYTCYTGMPQGTFQRMIKLPGKIAISVPQELEKLFLGITGLKYGRDAISLQLLYSLLSYPDDSADLVHSHFGPNGNLGAMLKQIGEIDNLVVTFHGTDIEQPYCIKNRYKPAFKLADRIIVKSEYNKKRLLELGATSEKILVHPVGVNTDRFHFRWKETNVQNIDKVIILSIGRLAPEKGYTYALKAIKQVIERNSGINIEYRIVGAGTEEANLKKKVRELELDNVVQFLGQQPAQEVSKQIEQAHVFLHSSIREGFGKVLLEAQAGGLPIVTTDAGGILEAVDAGQTALLASKANTEELADQLNHLINNRAQWKPMGKAGYQYVRENFDNKILNNRLYEIYEDIVAE